MVKAATLEGKTMYMREYNASVWLTPDIQKATYHWVDK